MKMPNFRPSICPSLRNFEIKGILPKYLLKLGGETERMGSRNVKIATKCGCSQKEQRRSKGSFRRKIQEPDGQVGNNPTISQETPLVEKKEKGKKEASLVTAGNIENLNFRFTIDSLTKEVNLLHLLSLKCRYEDREDPFCSKH